MEKQGRKQSWNMIWMGRETHHGHTVQGAKAVHGAEQQHDHATSFDSLDGPGQQIWGQGLKVLQHQHAVGVAQNLV